MTFPEMLKVDSSNIESMGYDSDNSALFVEFGNGAVYRYADVPKGVYTELVNADSVGKALHSLIRKGGYTYTTV